MKIKKQKKTKNLKKGKGIQPYGKRYKGTTARPAQGHGYI